MHKRMKIEGNKHHVHWTCQDWLLIGLNHFNDFNPIKMIIIKVNSIENQYSENRFFYKNKFKKLES